MRTKRILRDSSDAYCLIFHLLALLGYAGAFWIYLHPQRAHIHDHWSMVAFVAAATMMLGWVSGLDVPVIFHNHAHKPFFTVPWLNRWVGRLWTFSGGWPSFFFEHAHLTVHHDNLLGRRDWTLPHRRPDGRFESIVKYALIHWPWRFGYHFWCDFTARNRPPGIGRKALREFMIFVALWSIPFWIDVKMALLLWVLPQWFGNLTISGPGMYLQHAGCVPKSAERPYGHSNSTLAPLMNMMTFNLGYHAHHHEYPQVHWTQLPRLHEHMKPRLNANHARIFQAGYHGMANTLARTWLSVARRETLLRRDPEFPGNQAEGVPRFELAGPRDYLIRHGKPQQSVW